MLQAVRVETVGMKKGLELGGWSSERVYRVVGGTRWVGGVSVVWVEKRRRSPAMMTEGGVEVQLEWERQGRERERTAPLRPL